jgi:hypothetical protein
MLEYETVLNMLEYETVLNEMTALYVITMAVSSSWPTLSGTMGEESRRRRPAVARPN